MRAGPLPHPLTRRPILTASTFFRSSKLLLTAAEDLVRRPALPRLGQERHFDRGSAVQAAERSARRQSTRPHLGGPRTVPPRTASRRPAHQFDICGCCSQISLTQRAQTEGCPIGTGVSDTGESRAVVVHRRVPPYIVPNCAGSGHRQSVVGKVVADLVSVERDLLLRADLVSYPRSGSFCPGPPRN